MVINKKLSKKLVEVLFAKTVFVEVHFVGCIISFIPLIILKTFKFKFSVLFRTHTLLDRSSRVLQLPTPLSKLIATGY